MTYNARKIIMYLRVSSLSHCAKTINNVLGAFIGISTQSEPVNHLFMKHVLAILSEADNSILSR